uniref:Uncharacterized protein n=1 Tax=Meloidogyne enterolobii TaxID=390850 RepID=A0A6V7VXV5_MELEN|nr:unnamed protein product [Meloidogyne enterolobii]
MKIFFLNFLLLFAIKLHQVEAGNCIRGASQDTGGISQKILYLADSKDYIRLQLAARLANILDSNRYCVVSF